MEGRLRRLPRGLGALLAALAAPAAAAPVEPPAAVAASAPARPARVPELARFAMDSDGAVVATLEPGATASGGTIVVEFVVDDRAGRKLRPGARLPVQWDDGDVDPHLVFPGWHGLWFLSSHRDGSLWMQGRSMPAATVVPEPAVVRAGRSVDRNVAALLGATLGASDEQLAAAKGGAKPMAVIEIETRAEAVRALCDLWPDDALPELDALVAHPDPVVRLLALRGRTHFGVTAGIDAALPMLLDPPPDLKLPVTELASDLFRARGDAAVQALAVPMTRSSVPSVRASAASILGEMRTPGAIAALVRLLDDPDLAVRYRAYLAFAHLAGQERVVARPAYDADEAALLQHWRDWAKRQPGMQPG